jgi:1,4-dihydroxy-2-naphthoate octaprenyltransferase
MGAALAAGRDAFQWTIFLLCLSTTLCLQVLSNYANDLGDFLQGTDNDDRVGPTRAIQSGAISSAGMQKAVILLSLLALGSGIGLIYSSGLSLSGSGMIFLALGLLAILAAIKYTAGKNPYGYAGFGDLSVFFFFGMLGVLGSAYLHSHLLPFSKDVLAASAIGFLSTAVLNLNNMRDAFPDKESNKITVAVRLGNRGAKIYHLLLVSFGLVCILLYVLIGLESPFEFTPLLVSPFLVAHMIRVGKNVDSRLLDPELKKVALATFLLSILTLVSKTF